MQTQNNTEMCYQKRNRSTQRKTSLRPSKLNLSNVLEPSSYQRTSSSHVFTSYQDPAISSKLHLPIKGFFQCIPCAPKFLSTLRLGEISVWAKNLSRICYWRGRSSGKLREIVKMIMGLQSLILKYFARIFSLKVSLQFHG